MIIGALSDTHKIRKEKIEAVMEEFRNRGAKLLIHCGDIGAMHLDPDLFLNLPVICALTEDQVGSPRFKSAPPNWRFTVPGNRIVDLEDDTRMYVGHKMSFEFLTGAEEKLMQRIQELRKDYDGLRYVLSGHTHHQIFSQTPLTNFVNPGAVCDSFDGYEFCVINTGDNEVVFSRVMKTNPVIKPFSVGIISDSANISKMDPGFWKKLREEFDKRNVGWVVHCGNMNTDDIGRPELDGLVVHYNLHPRQNKSKRAPGWYLIGEEGHPVIEIEGYRFWIWHDLGGQLLEKSELDMQKICAGLRLHYPDLAFLLCGFTNNAFLEEGGQIRIINPGDAIRDRNFATVCLPRAEITFGHVPLPEKDE